MMNEPLETCNLMKVMKHHSLCTSEILLLLTGFLYSLLPVGSYHETATLWRHMHILPPARCEWPGGCLDAAAPV